MTLGDLIDEVVDSLLADGISPFPGFFTLATIANAVFIRGWERKQGTPSAIKRYLNDYYEVKRSGRRTYYGGNKRR